MFEPHVRYESAEEDSARWDEFPFRQGDIVISTRSKSGTTWMQMICALLVFQNPNFPDSLPNMSPWLDHLIVPKDEVYARLGAQRHRRFIKTHTPLDGIPIDERATYVVVARHPLDMAVSLYHQSANLDRERIHKLTNRSEPFEPPAPRTPLHEWLLRWMSKEVSPMVEMDSLPGVMWHLSDAWTRRLERSNVILVHYDDLLGNLAGEMRRIAQLLDIRVPEEAWPTLVNCATFNSMRSRANELAPNSSNVLKDTAAFFRRGTSGSGRELLTSDELGRYHERAGQLASPDLLEWLHR